MPADTESPLLPIDLWTSSHQMTIQGKRDRFSIEDIIECGSMVGIRGKRAKAMLADVRAAVAEWTSFARDAGVNEAWIGEIARNHRDV